MGWVVTGCGGFVLVVWFWTVLVSLFVERGFEVA